MGNYRLSIETTDTYNDDIACIMEQGRKIATRQLTKLKYILRTIRTTPNPNDFPSNYRYHTFKYKYNGVDYGTVVDVHIEGDLILLYKVDKYTDTLLCIRIGDHRRLKIGSSTELSKDAVYIYGEHYAYEI